MLKMFLSHIINYLNPDDSLVFQSVCQKYGITWFYFFKDMGEAQLNSIPGCYIFIDNYTIPVYVGKSGNLKQRVKKSHADYDGERVVIVECDFKKAGIIESSLIACFQPRKNKRRLIR